MTLRDVKKNYVTLRDVKKKFVTLRDINVYYVTSFDNTCLLEIQSDVYSDVLHGRLFRVT